MRQFFSETVHIECKFSLSLSLSQLALTLFYCAKKENTLLLTSKNNSDLQRLTERFIKISNQLIREFLAELLGTFMLVSFGLSAGAQFKFSSLDNPATTSPFSVHFGGGLGVGLSILTVGKVTGDFHSL